EVAALEDGDGVLRQVRVGKVARRRDGLELGQGIHGDTAVGGGGRLGQRRRGGVHGLHGLSRLWGPRKWTFGAGTEAHRRAWIRMRSRADSARQAAKRADIRR